MLGGEMSVSVSDEEPDTSTPQLTSVTRSVAVVTLQPIPGSTATCWGRVSDTPQQQDEAPKKPLQELKAVA